MSFIQQVAISFTNINMIFFQFATSAERGLEVKRLACLQLDILIMTCFKYSYLILLAISAYSMLKVDPFVLGKYI